MRQRAWLACAPTLIYGRTGPSSLSSLHSRSAHACAVGAGSTLGLAGAPANAGLAPRHISRSRMGAVQCFAFLRDCGEGVRCLHPVSVVGHAHPLLRRSRNHLFLPASQRSVPRQAWPNSHNQPALAVYRADGCCCLKRLPGENAAGVGRDVSRRAFLGADVQAGASRPGPSSRAERVDVAAPPAPAIGVRFACPRGGPGARRAARAWLPRLPPWRRCRVPPGPSPWRRCRRPRWR